MSAWTYMERKAVRDTDGIPAWVPLGDDDPDFKRLWMEDYSHSPDAEHSEDAWLRIFNEPFRGHKHLDPAVCEHWDGGDCDVYLFPGNRVYESSYRGVTIWQYIPPRKFE